MYLHVDGARLANAAASLDLPLRALTTDAGVDVLSFGGTKNGLLLGDAVVFLRPELARDLPLHPQATRAARLEDAVSCRPVRRPPRRATCGERTPRTRTRWRGASPTRSRSSTASGSPTRSRRTASSLTLPAQAIERLRDALPAALPFYVWDEAAGTIRLMCSWDTTEEDVDELATALAEAL